ncbi:unnamed protein product [Ectocarpus sp. CCAP 1310/34]|nr:unnamed protein product [Ectocarpus sp. CCAP 1310/34]
MLSGLTKAPEFKFIREMHYRDNFTSVDSLQATATRFFVDQQSRNASGPVVSGRGAAMAVASDTDQCRRCKAYGHFQRYCPQQGQKSRHEQSTKREQTSEEMVGVDAECQKQKEIQENKQNELEGFAANLALLQSASHANFLQLSNNGSAHVAQSSPAVAQQAPSEPTSFGFSFNALGTSLAEATSSSASSQPAPNASAATQAAPASASPTSSAQDHRLPSGFFGAFMATHAELSLAPFRSDVSSIQMVVDSGATDNYLDPGLTPGLRAHMRDVERLRVPHTIVAAGQHVLKGVATGTIFGAVTDDNGNDRHVSFRGILVPGLGTNLFSVTLAMLKGVATLFHPDNPRLESRDVVFPMQTLGLDATTGKRIYSIEVKLGGEPGGPTVLGDAPDALALKVESADLWFRRMGHINGKTLDVLRKEPVNGVHYTGDVNDCSVESADLWFRRMGHINGKTLDVLRKEPVNGVHYTGDVNDCSVCPLGKSAQQPHPKQATYGVLRPFQHVSVDTLGPFTPTALGGFKYATKFMDQQTKWAEIVLMKDKTCSVDSLALFNKGTAYCQDIGIKLEFASPNTPQQIGANERAGRTILNVVRCLLADSTLPNFLWGELIQTAVYLSNRVPHAALQNGTPCKELYETHTRKLEYRAWEGRLVGYSMGSKSYQIYNSETRRVRVSRNVVFIETPPVAPALDEGGFDDGEFTYDNHDDMGRPLWFTEYAYAMGASQPDVSRKIDAARAMPDGEQWDAAAEIASLKERQVYKLVPRTAFPPGRKRIKSKWVFKRKTGGSFKGRLVAQGWNQVPGLDGGSTYAPVCRLQRIRMLACIAEQFNLQLDQMDVSTAFPYADILENVFVEQPPGFEVKDKDGGDLVMQLQKSLYRLAKNPSNWFHTVDPSLVEIGFVPLKSDTASTSGNNSNAISMIKKKLRQRFKMTDMAEVKLVLGMEIKRDRIQGTLTIAQEAYSKSVYLREGIMGCLMYIAQVLRYDIMHATGPPNGETQQGSTMEAELIASALAMKEAVFCSNMLTELGFGKEFAQVPLYCDNTATLHALENRSFSSRTKHIALRFLYIRELVSEGRISIHYIPIEATLPTSGQSILTRIGSNTCWTSSAVSTSTTSSATSSRVVRALTLLHPSPDTYRCRRKPADTAPATSPTGRGRTRGKSPSPSHRRANNEYEER